jgi:hypothetical protein
VGLDVLGTSHWAWERHELRNQLPGRLLGGRWPNRVPTGHLLRESNGVEARAHFIARHKPIPVTPGADPDNDRLDVMGAQERLLLPQQLHESPRDIPESDEQQRYTHAVE